MRSVAVGHSRLLDPERAAAEACGAAIDALGATADAALVFTAGAASGRSAFLEATRRFETPHLVGATACAVLGTGRADEGPGIAVLAMTAGRGTETAWLDDLRGRESSAGAELLDAFGSPCAESDLVVLLADVAGLDISRLLASISASCAPAQIVGGGAFAERAGESRVARGDEIGAQALAALRIRGASPPAVGVTTSCQPASPVFAATRVEGHWIYELAGRPALTVFREAVRGPLASDLSRAARFVLATRLLRGREFDPRFARPSPVVGFDEGRKAIALPEPVPRGTRVAFVLRDGMGAREDLAAMLDRLPAAPAAGGLYFDCHARGRDLFGVHGLEGGTLERARPGLPFAGMLGACEFGPIGPAADRLTHAAVFALFD